MAYWQAPDSWRSQQTRASYQTPSSTRRVASHKHKSKPGDLAKTDAPVIAEISRADLSKLLSPEEAKITGLEHLASYNWVNTNVPTIIVPDNGVPPIYNAPVVPPKLDQDFGTFFIDQNAARNPNSPLEPLFRSLITVHPTLDMSGIDLVTDRNNIRKLLRFVGTSANDQFEIQVEIVGEKTTLFTRVSPQHRMNARGTSGFGHNFEKAVTKDQLGTGHHRIISYQFGGMKMIVRFETDAYLDEKHGDFGEVAFMLPTGFGAETNSIYSAPPEETYFTAIQTARGEGFNIGKTPALGKQPITDQTNMSKPLSKPPSTQTRGSLSNQLNSLSLTPPNAKNTPYKPPLQQGLQVQSLGHPIPASQILEIKTRSARSKTDDLRDTLPQLWISQTPHLLIGYHHSGGWFDSIDLKDMRSKIAEWETANQENLGKLVGLLKWIFEKVNEVEGRRGTVRFEGGDMIRVLAQDVVEESTNGLAKERRRGPQQKNMQRRALPDGLYERWSGTNDNGHGKGIQYGDADGEV